MAPPTPKDIADLDQAAAALGEHIPPLWRSIFNGCVRSGFTEDQAMDLTKTYVATTNRPQRSRKNTTGTTDAREASNE